MRRTVTALTAAAVLGVGLLATAGAAQAAPATAEHHQDNRVCTYEAEFSANLHAKADLRSDVVGRIRVGTLVQAKEKRVIGHDDWSFREVVKSAAGAGFVDSDALWLAGDCR